MSGQLTFDLPLRTAMGRGAFFVSPTNEEAIRALDAHESWPEGKMLIIGAPGAGKTHLCHVWAEAVGARIIPAERLSQGDPAALMGQLRHVAVDGIDAVSGNIEAEQTLFHLHNMLSSAGGRLLATARAGRPLFGLPDLQSRIDACSRVLLGEPDDALLAAVMVKQLADRQLDITPSAITYLARHMERSFEAARRVVDALDRAALSGHRRLSRALAIEVLDKLSRPGA